MDFKPVQVIPPKAGRILQDTQTAKILAGSTEKACSRCHIVKPLTEFYRSKVAASGYQGYCKSCRKEYDQARQYNPELSQLQRNKVIEKRWGCSYDELLEKYGDKCNICGNLDTIRLAVDHSHKTGTLRGLLCGSCNRAIGLFQDNIETLQRAITYLKERDSG